MAGSVANSTAPKSDDVVWFSLTMKLVHIPPGEFEMGAPASDRYGDPGEKLHHVKLTKSFYLGAYEVTQSQFQQVLGRSPSQFSEGGGSRSVVSGKDTSSFPVEQVSWYDAVDFCNALSRSEGLPEYYTLRSVERLNDSIKSAEVAENGGKGYRLPTEAEWEYACRAGTKTQFHFGDMLTCKDANVMGEWRDGKLTDEPSLKRPREVGSYPPNKFGLYDMHGNVAEWCNDWHGRYAGSAVDPKGPASGENEKRVVRGGDFLGEAPLARSATRVSWEPWMCLFFGFRVAKDYP